MSNSASGSWHESIPKLFAPGVFVAAALMFSHYLLPRDGTPGTDESQALEVPAWRGSGFAPALSTDDPFEIAYATCSGERLPNAPACSCTSLASGPLPSSTTDRFSALRGAPWRLLLVYLPGGAREEQCETRRRLRLATHVALQSEGYHLTSAGRLQLVHLPDFPAAVACEMFRSSQSGDSKRGVLLVWIDELIAADHPYGCAASFADNFVGAVGFAPERIDAVGPTSTDMVAALIKDASVRVTAATSTGYAVDHWTAHATAPIAGEKDYGWRFPADSTDDAVAVEVKRAIHRDDALADLLVAELAQRIPALMQLEGWRGIEKCSPLLQEHCVLGYAAAVLRAIGFLAPRDVDGDGSHDELRIAIVSEQDTGYGRSWQATLTAAWQRYADNNNVRVPLCFELIGYQRGIAGTGAGGDSAGEKDYPLGTSQVDYVRQIQGPLLQRHRYAAIGIFGSDARDTLSLLAALRPRFESSVFFSTDLDARYFHARHLSYMRNLLVASHASLDQSTETAPLHFRDSYQANLYRLVKSLIASNDAGPSAPVLHEIGNGQPLELAVQRSGTRAQPTAGLPRSQVFAIVDAAASVFVGDVQAGSRSPAPVGQEFAEWPALLLVASLVLIAGGFGFLLANARRRVASTRKSNGAFEPVPRLRWSDVAPWVALPLGSIAIVFVSVRWINSVALDGTSESLDVTSGTSAWPAVIARCLTTFFCLWSILVIHRRLSRGHADCEAEFMLNVIEERPQPAPLPAGWRWPFAALWRAVEGWMQRGEAALHRWREWICSPEQPGADGKLNELWERVGTALRSRWLTAARLAVYVFLMYVLVLPFFLVFGAPASPVRGEVAFVIDKLTTLASVVALMALIAYVAETLLVTSRIVGWIGERIRLRVPAQVVFNVTGADENDLWLVDRQVRIELIERISREVEPIVFLPACAIAMTILSRAAVFDAWSWPGVLIGLLISYFVILVACAASLRKAARRVKSDLLAELRLEQHKCLFDVERTKRFDLAVARIERINHGAFAPIGEHPLLRSTLVPIAASASTVMLEFGVLRTLLGG